MYIVENLVVDFLHRIGRENLQSWIKTLRRSIPRQTVPIAMIYIRQLPQESRTPMTASHFRRRAEEPTTTPTKPEVEIRARRRRYFWATAATANSIPVRRRPTEPARWPSRTLPLGRRRPKTARRIRRPSPPPPSASAAGEGRRNRRRRTTTRRQRTDTDRKYRK